MSKEYIERDAVLNDIAELFTLCHETLPNECGHHFVVEADLETHWDFVKNLPAADVREVVLCRDCRDQQVCRLAQYLGLDGFCSNGERQTNGAEMRGDADHV